MTSNPLMSHLSMFDMYDDFIVPTQASSDVIWDSALSMQTAEITQFPVSSISTSPVFEKCVDRITNQEQKAA